MKITEILPKDLSAIESIRQYRKHAKVQCDEAGLTGDYWAILPENLESTAEPPEAAVGMVLS